MYAIDIVFPVYTVFIEYSVYFVFIADNIYIADIVTVVYTVDSINIVYTYAVASAETRYIVDIVAIVFSAYDERMASFSSSVVRGTAFLRFTSSHLSSSSLNKTQRLPGFDPGTSPFCNFM